MRLIIALIVLLIVGVYINAIKLRALEKRTEALNSRIEAVVKYNEFIHGVSIDVAGPPNMIK